MVSSKSILVSVIVPVFNVEKYLSKCVASIVNQTHKTIEIILVDDGATDCSSSLCDEWAHKDDRVRVIHKSNGGLSSARNAGIEVAIGDYFVFVDGDDFIDEEMIANMLVEGVHTKADMVVSGFKMVDDDGTNLCHCCVPAGLYDEKGFWQLMYEGNSSFDYSTVPLVVVWNKLYKRHLFENECFDIGKVHEDEYILHRLIRQCNYISIIDSCYYNYVQREGSIMHSRNTSNTIDAAEALLYRSKYLNNTGFDAAATCTAGVSLTFLAEAHYLPQSESDNTRFLKLQMLAKELLSDGNLGDLNLKDRFRTKLFLVDPMLYYITWKIHHK